MVPKWLIEIIAVSITSTYGSPLECVPEVIVIKGSDPRTGRTLEALKVLAKRRRQTSILKT